MVSIDTVIYELKEQRGETEWLYSVLKDGKNNCAKYLKRLEYKIISYNEMIEVLESHNKIIEELRYG